jgi:outer membrane protein TolC
MGRDLRTLFNAAPVLEPASFDFDLSAAQTRALEQRTELQEARLRRQQATLARKIKQAEKLPEVGLTVGYFPLLGFEFLPRQVGLIGVAVKWEPFDWGRKRRELHDAEKNLAQTDNALREAETQILLDVNARYRKLQEARALLRVTQASQAASTEKLRVALNKFKQEAALMKDVLQTQAAVAESNHQYQQALFAFLTARADFEKALGEQ